MRCEVVRLRLLSKLDPSQPSDVVRAHLEDCEFCRDWHNDLCTFERSVPYVPVPRSRGKARLLSRLLDPNDKLHGIGNPSTRETTLTLRESATATVVDSP